MPSGGVRRGKDIVPDPRTRPAEPRRRRATARRRRPPRARTPPRARAPARAPHRRCHRRYPPPTPRAARRIARSSVAARRRSASGHARVPPSARSRRQVVVTASPSLACCGPRFCFCFFAWSPRTPARGEAREASPSSALSTSGRRSRARCASVVAGARSAPPRVRHALSACARVTGRCPSSRFASASPASALPRTSPPRAARLSGTCRADIAAAARERSARFGSPRRLRGWRRRRRRRRRGGGERGGEPLLVQVHELLVD